jgi:antitoxin CptB
MGSSGIGQAMKETAEARLKRLAMRSWRRGTKEMDLVLGPWSDVHLAGLSAAELDVYEVLLAENDQDLMAWILGQGATPAQIAPMLDRIAAHAKTRLMQRN